MDSNAFDRLKHGDERDIRSLYQEYHASFVRYISMAFQCHADKAKEIYPEAFSILYFNIKQEKLSAPLKSTLQTYLNSTGWNVYHRRHLDKYQRDKVALENADVISDVKNLVDDALMKQDRATHLRNLLNTLGDPCKTLLYKVYYDESNYQELALSMGLPENTLRKRKFDCLNKLRRLFDEQNLEL